MSRKIGSVSREIELLAQAKGVTACRDKLSTMAVTITQLAGDRVELDRVEQMLVNLKRLGALSKSQAIEYQRAYAQEKRQSKAQTKELRAL